MLVFHGGDQIVCPALFEQAAGCLLLSVQGVAGDDAPGEVDLLDEFPECLYRIGLAGDLQLSQHHAAALLHGRDQHAPTLCGLL